MYEYDKIMWCNVTYCAQTNNLPHSSSSYLWCSFIPELLCKYLTVNRFQRRFTPLGIYRVTKTGVFFDIWNNTWPRLVPEPRCYIPRKGGCSATRSQLPRSDVFQTYLVGYDMPGGMGGSRVDRVFPGLSRCFHPLFFFEKRPSDNKAGNGDNLGFHRCEIFDKCRREDEESTGSQMEEQLIKRTGPKCGVFMSKHN